MSIANFDTNTVIFALLALHLIFCAVLLVLKIIGIFRCDGIMLFLALFVPVVGLYMLLMKHYSDRHDDRIGGSIDVERPRASEERKSIDTKESEKEVVPIHDAFIMNDEATRRNIMKDILYNVSRSIVVDQDEIKEKVVPIGEALVVNDTATKRELLIDVLYSNPSDYVSQLYDAKANGDTEVVHYAATALAEIQKEYDLRFQDLADRRVANDPNDLTIDDEYRLLLENYINSGLLYGEALRSQLLKYSDILEEKLSKDNVKGRWSLINKKAGADLRLEAVDRLEKDVEYMEKLWPDRENVFLYRIQMGVLKKDKNLVLKTIEEIKDQGVYVSSELRNAIRFWDQNVKEW